MTKIAHFINLNVQCKIVQHTNQILHYLHHKMAVVLMVVTSIFLEEIASSIWHESKPLVHLEIPKTVNEE